MNSDDDGRKGSERRNRPFDLVEIIREGDAAAKELAFDFVSAIDSGRTPTDLFGPRVRRAVILEMRKRLPPPGHAAPVSERRKANQQPQGQDMGDASRLKFAEQVRAGSKATLPFRRDRAGAPVRNKVTKTPAPPGVTERAPKRASGSSPTSFKRLESVFSALTTRIEGIFRNQHKASIIKNIKSWRSERIQKDETSGVWTDVFLFVLISVGISFAILEYLYDL